MADQIDAVFTKSLRDRGDTTMSAYRDSNGALYYSTSGPRDRPSFVSAGQQSLSLIHI